MIFVLTLLLIFRVINTLSGTVNPIQQRLQYQYQMTDWNNSLYFTIEQKYIPASYQYSSQQSSSINYYLIFAIQNGNLTDLEGQNVFLHYLKIDTTSKTLTHYLEILTQKQKYIQQFTVTNQNYEGFWYSLEIRNDALQKSLNITYFQNSNKNLIFQKIYQNEYFVITDNFSFYLGESKISKKLGYLQFQGVIKFQLIANTTRFSPTSQPACSSTSGYAMKGQSNFTSDQYYEYTIKDLIFKSYGVTTWVKIEENKPINNNYINVLHIQQNPNLKYQNQIGGKIAQVIYLINSTKQQIQIFYQTYSFPSLPQLLSNNVDPLEKSVIYEIDIQYSLFNWHYFSYSFRNNQIYLNLNFMKQNYQFIKTITNVYQFSDLMLVIHLGGTAINRSNTNGQFNLPYFYTCLNSYTPRCHYSCSTCSGPQSNQCLSCSTSSNRQLSFDFKCICKIGFLDINISSCYRVSLSIVQDTLMPLSNTIGYDQEDPKIICSYGYFKYDDKCYQCPKLSKQYFCPECIQYTNTWVYNPICSKNYQQYNQSENNTFTQDIILPASILLLNIEPYEVYLFNDEQLTICAYCNSLCVAYPYSSECQQSNYSHLQQKILVTCQYSAILLDGECKYCQANCSKCNYINQQLICVDQVLQQTLSPRCQQINENVCFQCYDNSNYFLNMESNDCYPCTIPNCKYCFQYLKSDISYNTIFQQQAITYEQEDLAVACALCQSGYSFSFITGKCEKYVQSQGDLCQTSYINSQGKSTCLIDKDFSLSYSVSDCRQYLSKCITCVKVLQNTYYCLQCEFGYYLHYTYGVCMSCTDFNSLYLECEQQQLYETKFKFELTPFFYSLAKQYPGQQVPKSLKIVVKTCISNYGTVNDILCSKTDTINCEYYDKGCRTCASTNEGTKRLTILNLKCTDCPYFCEYCKPRQNQDLYLINPFLNTTAIPLEQTFRCIMKSSVHQNIFFDNRVQIPRICSAEIPNCELYHKQNFTSLRNLQSNMITLSQSNNLNYFYLRGSTGFSFFINSSSTNIIENSFFALYDIQNTYILLILSVKYTKVTYYSQSVFYGLIFGGLRFLNYQEIEFKQTSILFSLTQSSKLVFESLQIINLSFENCIISDSNTTFSFYYQIFDTSISQRSYQISVQNPNRINFTNILIQNISLFNTTFLNLTTVNKEINQLDFIYFQNVTFFNCSFTQTNFITLLDVNQYNQITIIKLSFINCNFSDSHFIYTFGLQLKGKFILENIVMKNCLMRNSSLITIPATITTTTINELDLQNVQFYSSDVIRLTSSTFIQNVLVRNSSFLNSKIIYKIKQLILFSKEEYFIENFQIFDCYYQEFNIISIPQYNVEYIDVKLKSIYTYNLYSLNRYLNMNYPLFQFQVAQIIIEDLSLIRQPGSIDFIIKDCEHVSISNVKVLSKNLTNISFEQNDIKQETLNTIFIIESQQIQLDTIFVQNQLLIDVTFFLFNLIKLQDSINGYLIIQNINIENVQLLKQSFSETTTIFYITTLNTLNISISNSQFNGILLNEFVQDTKISSAAIAVIISESSLVKLENNLINNVAVINSSNSIFLIQTQQTILQNITSKNVNNYQSYINVYQQKQIIQLDLINAPILINSQGGLFNFLIQELVIFSCYFENIVGLQGGVLSITTKFFGFIDIQQTIFINSSTNFYRSQEGRGGSIYINSENSYLNLLIKDTQFVNSTSGLEGGVMYIKPSKYQCYLKVQNVTFKDVFAVHYSIIFFQIIDANLDSISSIELVNIEIENSFLQLIQFLQTYQIDLNNYKINEQSAMFSLQNVFIYLNHLKVTGYIAQPILYLTYIKCIFLDNIIIYNIISLFSPLIYIENTPIFKSTLMIKSTQISQFNQMDFNQIQKYYKIENINDTSKYKSLLEIVLNNNITSAQINSLKINNNNCKNCQSGLVDINNKQISKKIRFINLLFYKNICGLGSCLNINSIISQNFNFLSQSIFHQNTAQKGGAIYLQNFRLKIHETIFLSNIALDSGGAINYQTQNSTQLLEFKYVSFIKNQAQIGGAIYDNNNYILDSITFQLVDNKAHYFANNLATQPTQLSFYINNQSTIKQNQIIKNKTIQIVSYLNNSKLTKFIYMPSGVSLNNYQKINMNTNANTILDYNFNILAFNCLNEQIFNLKQTQCELNLSEISKNQSLEIQKNSGIQNIMFNEEKQLYDLKDQIFILDPYQNDNFYLQIDTQCNSIQTKDYYLRFFVKTFHCQIGEYFENEQCLKCDSLQGYYSVEVKSTQCNRINIQMIKSTTGSMIELQPGYWRPSYRSNKIERCEKFPNRCLGGWDVLDNTCFIGSYGALCEECDLFNIRGQGSYLNNQERICQKCSQFSVQLIFMALESIWIILLIFLTVRSNNFSNRQLFKLKCLYRHYQTIYKQMMDQTTTLIKMANNNFQILSLISTLQISIFSSLSNLVIFLGDSTNIITYQLDCSIPSISTIQYEYAHFIIILLLPLFHFGSSCFVFLIFLIKKYVKFSKSYIYSSIIYLYCLNLQKIMKWGVSLITKRQLAGIDWIQANVASRYGTVTHSQWSIKFIYPILIFIGIIIPAFLFYQMRKIRKSLADKNSIQKFSFLYNEYTDKSYYWEIIKMLQKISIILIVNYFEQSVLIKGIFMFLIVLVYYKLCLEIQPYKLQSISQIDGKISFLLSITLICSVLLYVIQQEDLYYLNYATQIIILFLIYKQTEFLLRRIFIVYVQRLNLQLDSLRQQVLVRFPQLYNKYKCLRPYLMLRKEQEERIQQRFKKIRQFIKNKSKQVKEKNIYVSHTYRESSFIGSYPQVSTRPLYTEENGQMLKSTV